MGVALQMIKDLSWDGYMPFKHSRYVEDHRLENRCVLKHFSNMNFHSWAFLGSRGYREKKILTAVIVLLLRPVFYVFVVKNYHYFLIP